TTEPRDRNDRLGRAGRRRGSRFPYAGWDLSRSRWFGSPAGNIFCWSVLEERKKNERRCQTTFHEPHGCFPLLSESQPSPCGRTMTGATDTAGWGKLLRL